MVGSPVPGPLGVPLTATFNGGQDGQAACLPPVPRHCLVGGCSRCGAGAGADARGCPLQQGTEHVLTQQRVAAFTGQDVLDHLSLLLCS